MRLGNGTAPSVFLDSLQSKHWAVLLLSLFSIMVLSSVCLFTFARDATKRLTCLSASSFPNMSVSAHPDVNTEKLSCWISSPWKEFSKSSIFRDLKCCLRVYERPKCREKNFVLKIPVCVRVDRAREAASARYKSCRIFSLSCNAGEFQVRYFSHLVKNAKDKNEISL